MQSAVPSRRLAMAMAGILAIGAVAACGSAVTTPAPSGSIGPAPTVAPVVTSVPEPTDVPGGQTQAPEPTGGPSKGTTTQTEWGEIVDVLPEAFPVFPDAEIAEPPAEAVSGAFLAPAGVDEVASWYQDALEMTGKTTISLSSALEDGSRILDMQGDIPECLVQVAFSPVNGSTMILVRYGAACVGLAG
jgi:hypothetical protein